MKRDLFRVSFFLKKNQLLKNGEAPVSMRITVRGEREELRIKKSVKPSLWCQAKEFSRGKDKNSRDLNDYIQNARIRMFQIFDKLEQDGKNITAEILKNKFFGMEDEDNKTLLGCMREHNEQCRQLIGIDYAEITIRRYECCTRYLQELIQQKYGEKDLLLKEINREFVKNFEFFMKTEKKCQNNTVIRYMKCLKKVINLAIANEWMSRNPFAGIKFHETEVHKDFLTQEEIDTIYAKEFEIPRLKLVRDIFVFCCYTGLAFIDVQQLRPEHIITDNNGVSWVRISRQKTKNMCNIPLLAVPKQILKKYENNPYCLDKGVLLPVMCNQKMNSYLKEIADFCGIRKNLTMHVARHTFASVITLANNVSLKNVAKMLGHSSTRMTERYAKVLDQSILKDMMQVDKRLSI